MYQISCANRYCLNVLEDKAMKHHYHKHLSRLAEIHRQKSCY